MTHFIELWCRPIFFYILKIRKYYWWWSSSYYAWPKFGEYFLIMLLLSMLLVLRPFQSRWSSGPNLRLFKLSSYFCFCAAVWWTDSCVYSNDQMPPLGKLVTCLLVLFSIFLQLLACTSFSSHAKCNLPRISASYLADKGCMVLQQYYRLSELGWIRASQKWVGKRFSSWSF